MSNRFSHRAEIIEIMDDLQCSGEVVHQTLRELEIINRWLGGNAVTLQGIKILLESKKINGPFAIADIGCGGGDGLKKIAAWGRSKKLTFNLTGIDANPNIIAFAKQNSSGFDEINYVTSNIFDEHFKQTQFDIVVATLFTHHLTNEELIILLKSLLQQCRIGIVINDLHRHWLAYYSIRLLTKWFSKSTMVKYDAHVSVLRSFSRKDILRILRKAGISNYSLKWKWAFRWQLIIPSSLA